MLNKLTPEQEVLMHKVKEEWLTRFFSCKNKLNKEEATKAIKWLYSFCKLKDPYIIFVSSPYAAQIAVNYAKAFIAEVHKVLKKKDQVGEQVWDQVWGQVWDQVREQVREQVWEQVWGQVRGYESFSSYGNVSDYGWVAFHDFFQRLGLVKNTNFDSFMQLLKSNLYDMIQLDGLCIVCELPTLIKRNPENRLHSTTSFAIEWSDGYELYFINGRAITADNFKKASENKITKEMWFTETNEDVKAAWFEILGAEKVMTVLEAKEIDSKMQIHANGDLEDLRLFKTPFILPEIGEPLAWVKFICPSTGSNYLISVNPKHTKVMDAVLDTCPFYGNEIKDEADYSFSSRG